MQNRVRVKEWADVKKIVGRLVLVLGLTGVVIGGILWLDPYQDLDKRRHINASIIEKQALLNKQPSPRIILVAGSNFLYGIDSDSLEQWVGLPVINMALPYYLGSDFLLKQIAHALRPGDIVVLGFEYMMTREGQINEKMLTAQFYPPAKEWITHDTWQSALSAPWIARFLRIRKMISRMFTSFEEEPDVEDTTNELFRFGIDGHGDLVSQDNNPAEKSITSIPMTTEQDFLPVIDTMADMIVRHPEVRFYYLFPTLSETGYQADQTYIDRIESKLKQIPRLNRVSDSVYPDSLFHNSIYHLTPAGRRWHTQRVANWLKRTL